MAAVRYTDLGFRAFDSDHHYYEAPDAFTRHIPKGWERRTMQWAEINGKRRLLVAGKVNRFIPNPLFDPVARPGAARRVLPRQARRRRHPRRVR